MALLILDTNTLELKVMVGVLEEYKPDREIKAINKKIVSLREETLSTLKELTGEDKMVEALEFLKTEKSKNEEFTAFVAGAFNNCLVEINLRIEKKNEKICPNYKENKK